MFEAIQCEFKISVLEEEFAKENRLYFDIGDDDSFTELDISVPKLRNKYNNLKKQWRARVDRAKNGSGLHVEREALWFQILHPVFRRMLLWMILLQKLWIFRSSKIKMMKETVARNPIRN